MSDWATSLAVAIKGLPSEFELMIGSVISPKPLSIRVSGATISQGLYIDPAYVLATESEITDVFKTEMSKSPQINEFLQEWHKAYTLNAGDIVILLRHDRVFYVLQKVVAA